MGEEFYSIIKLITGEEIFALVSIEENYEDSTIIMQNPVIIKTVNHHGTALIKIKPWIELASEDIFMIKPDRIITMTECKDERLIAVYNNYLNEEEDINFNNFSTQVGVSSEMGYISTVQDARKKLEELFKITKPKES